MTEAEIIRTLLQGGPVAILAYLIFWTYRHDRKSSEDHLRTDRIFMEDRLTKIIESDQRAQEHHTEVLTEIVTILRSMNGVR